MTNSVVSIAAVCSGELRDAILQSDKTRNMTLDACYSIPGYKYKSLKWKNRYYDYFRRKILQEMQLS